MAGSLAPAEQEAVDDHLDTCQACYHLLAAYGRGVTAEALASPGRDSAHRDEDRVSKLQRTIHRPGTQISRYLITQWLGAGGAGTVYAAYDPKLERKIALKLVPVDLMQDSAPSGALREARALAQLSHANIVAVHDAGLTHHAIFVAMEFVEGPTLGSWLVERPRTQREILEVLVGAGRGLAAAHAAGLVHRDFKPDNVLIGKDGRARVADFGLAHFADQPLGTPGPPRVVGTPAYMSPEQWRGLTVDARSDQYSFCLALWEALGGARPDPGTPPTSPPPKAVSRRVLTILTRGLAEAPAARFSSMAELLEALGHDPSLQAKRLVAAFAVVAMLVTALVGYRQATTAPLRRCAEAQAKLVGIWDSGRKEAIARSFHEVQLPFAEDTWRGVERTLDAYAHAWVAMRVDACEATVRGEQSAELLDRRMACLDDRLVELSARTELFSRADASVVKRALQTAQSTGSLTQCGDAKALLSRVRPPDETAARTVADVKKQIAEIDVLLDGGKFSEGAARTASVLSAARATHYPPVLALALGAAGQAALGVNDWGRSQELFLEAIAAADAAGDDRTRLYFTGELLKVSRVDRQKALESVPRLRASGEAILARYGRQDEAASAFWRGLAFAYEGIGDLNQALVAADQSYSLDLQTAGPTTVSMQIQLLQLASYLVQTGAVEEGRRANSMAADGLLAAFGPNHPLVGVANEQLAGILAMNGEFAPAEARFRTSLAVFEQVYGPESGKLVDTLANLAEMLVEQGRAADALPVLDRAMRLQQLHAKGLPTNLHLLLVVGRAQLNLGHSLRALELLEQALAIPAVGQELFAAEAQFRLAQTLTSLGRQPARAHALAVQARETYRRNAKLPVDQAALEAMEHWLAVPRHVKD